MLKYDPTQPWSVNIADLASKLESELRERSKTRPTILPFGQTNVPSLAEANENALKAFDRDTQVIQYQASAAKDGMYWHDPDTLRTPTACLNRDAQAWLAEARKRGKIVHPDEYFKSRHSAIHEPPILVRRGPAGTPDYGITRPNPQAGKTGL